MASIFRVTVWSSDETEAIPVPPAIVTISLLVTVLFPPVSPATLNEVIPVTLPVPTDDPLKNKAPPTLYSLFVVVPTFDKVSSGMVM